LPIVTLPSDALAGCAEALLAASKPTKAPTKTMRFIPASR
jgi:hypothetical protein